MHDENSLVNSVLWFKLKETFYHSTLEGKASAALEDPACGLPNPVLCFGEKNICSLFWE